VRVADAGGTDADLLVWIRTRTSLLDTLGDYATVRVPHLLVDLAYHHTLSIGPLVWPGDTACLGCFGGRIRHLWGDPTPPAAPRALAALPLAASLVQTELDVFRERGSCPALVERAVVLDLETLTTRVERVHRLPWCPFCFPPGAEHGAGSFALPWAAP
jgi:bacteriocin biosynthesis cyclodehydratase domain-containing protein